MIYCVTSAATPNTVNRIHGVASTQPSSSRAKQPSNAKIPARAGSTTSSYYGAG